MAPAYRSAYRVEATLRTLYTGSALAVPPCGGVLFCAAAGTVHKLDYASGRILASADLGDGDLVSVLAVSDDGATVFASSRGLQCRLWSSSPTGLEVVHTWQPAKQPCSAARFWPGSQCIAVGGSDGTVRVWDHSRAAMTHNLPNEGGVVTDMAFRTGDAPLIAVACFSGLVAVWSLETSERVATLHNHNGQCSAVSFFYDGAIMATASRDTKVNLYHVVRRPGGKKGVELTLSHSFTVLEEVWCLARVTPQLLGASYDAVVDDGTADKEMLCIAGEKGLLRYFYVERTGRARKCKKELPPSGAGGDGTSAVTTLWPVTGEEELVTSTADGDLVFHSAVFERKRLVVGNVDQVTDVRYGVADQIAAASNSADLRIFHSTSPFCDLLTGHTDVIVCLAASRCRRWLATGSKDRSIRIWDAEVLACVAELTGHMSDVTGVSFGTPVEGSSAPLRLASVSADLSLKLWDLRPVVDPKRRQKALQGQDSAVLKVESSPTNTQPRAHEADISAVEWNPTAELLASCSKDKTARLWAVSGSCVKALSVLKGHRRRVHSVAFSPVEKTVASGGGDNVVKIWSCQDGGCQKTLQGHATPVLCVRYINNGLQLVSASSDGAIKVWGLKHHTLLATLAGHGERGVWSLDVNGSETGFLSGGNDGAINVWKDYTEEDQRAEMKEKAQHVLESQQLLNEMRKGDYAAAIALGLKLQRRADTRAALRQLVRDQGLDGAEETIRGIVAGLGSDLLERLLGYARDWCMNSQHADVAACTLRAVLCTLHTTRLAALPAAASSLEALSSYSSRHYDRMRGLQQQLHVLDFFAGGSDAPASSHVLPAAELEEDGPTVGWWGGGEGGRAVDTGSRRVHGWRPNHVRVWEMPRQLRDGQPPAKRQRRTPS